MATKAETRTGTRATNTATARRRRTELPGARGGRGAATPAAGAPAPDGARSELSAVHALSAAEHAVRSTSMHIRLPIVGHLRLPAAQEVVFVGVVGALALIGLLEWPVAVVLAVGHGLAMSQHNKSIRAFGEALETV